MNQITNVASNGGMLPRPLGRPVREEELPLR